MSDSDVRVHPTAEESADACASFVLSFLRETLQSKPSATLAISGGSTPKLLFRRLAAASFDWSNVDVFWVDERCVPPDNEQSNFKLANDNWLSPAGVPGPNIHRVLGELAPDEAADRYKQEIQRLFGLGPNQVPEFDLLHRG